MDMLRRKRVSLPADINARQSLPRLDTEQHSSSTGSSPASSVDGKSDFFQSMVPRVLRSKSKSRSSTPQSPVPDSPLAHSPSRRLLQKSHSRASSFGTVGRRGSTSSEGFGRVSRASTAISASSSISVDWRSQHVERHAALEADPQQLRNKPGYLVITSDFVVVFKSKADALVTFPKLGNGDMKGGLTPEPLQVIPTHMIVAVFRAESSRPSFGIEVWWRCPYPTIAFTSTQFFFQQPIDRREVMHSILDTVKGKTREFPDASRVSFEIEDCIKRIVKEEEPGYPASEPEIFPVAYRNACQSDINTKTGDEKTKKSQDCGSYYFVVGINLCYFVEVARASSVQEAPLAVHYQSFGIVTLESFRGEWSPHEERFLLKFR
jgi:hypothetical protein